MTTQIGWNDGTGDKIYLSYSASEGNQTVTITSDANAGASSRSKNITFSVTAGQTTISRVLTVVQSAASGVLTIITRNGVASMDNSTVVGYKE